MSKYFQRGLALLYVLLTVICFLFVLVLSGVYISVAAGVFFISAWLLFCYFSAWFAVGPWLFFRRPYREEEERLLPCLEEILRRADCKKAVRLLIDEGGELNAFAAGHHTMAISGKALRDLTDEELKGLMAHALGHLTSKDSIVHSAVMTASQLPFFARFIFVRAQAIILKGFRLSWVIATGIGVLGGVVLLMALYYFMQGTSLFLTVLSVILFVFLFNILDRAFLFFYRIAARSGAYRQDAYAHRLGYGAGLSGVLKKAAAAGGQAANRYEALMNSNKPMIANRIRRLDDLSAHKDPDV